MTEDPRITLIREGFDAWESGDVQGALAHYHPEIEIFAPPQIGNAGTFYGVEGFHAWTQAWFEAWESFSQEVNSIETVGDRHALVRVTQTGVGKGSGIEVVRDATYVYELREDKLVYMALFFDHDEAIALAREREGGE
jgi:ketosteroid isomerase-like protein